MKGLDSPSNALVWSPDGRRVASGGCCGTVKISDAATGELLRTFRGHTWEVVGRAWSPNGERVASTSGDDSIRIWDATAEPESRVLQGQVRSVSAVAWSPDGRHLVGGGDKGRVEIWDVGTGRSVRGPWRAHDGACFYRGLRRWQADCVSERGRADQTVERGQGGGDVYARRSPRSGPHVVLGSRREVAGLRGRRHDDPGLGPGREERDSYIARIHVSGPLPGIEPRCRTHCLPLGSGRGNGGAGSNQVLGDSLGPGTFFPRGLSRHRLCSRRSGLEPGRSMDGLFGKRDRNLERHRQEAGVSSLRSQLDH